MAERDAAARLTAETGRDVLSRRHTRHNAQAIAAVLVPKRHGTGMNSIACRRGIESLNQATPPVPKSDPVQVDVLANSQPGKLASSTIPGDRYFLAMRQRIRSSCTVKSTTPRRSSRCRQNNPGNHDRVSVDIDLRRLDPRSRVGIPRRPRRTGRTYAQGFGNHISPHNHGVDHTPLIVSEPKDQVVLRIGHSDALAGDIVRNGWNGSHHTADRDDRPARRVEMYFMGVPNSAVPIHRHPRNRSFCQGRPGESPGLILRQELPG